MTIDQYLRRLTWRWRRTLTASLGKRPADNEPIVTLEGTPNVAAPAPSPKATPRKKRRAKSPPLTLRMRLRRWAGMAAAFAVSMVVLGGLYVSMVAFNSLANLTPPIPELAPAPGGAAAGVAVASAFLATPDSDDLAQANLFAPNVRAQRLAHLEAGAHLALVDFFTSLSPIRGTTQDRAVAEARIALEQAGPQAAETAHAALERLSGRLAQGETQLDGGAVALSAFAERIALRSEEVRLALAYQIESGPRNWPAPSVDAPFYKARGMAQAHSAIVRAWISAGDPLPPETAQRAAALAEILERIASYQPLFISNAAPGAPLSNNHLSVLALDLAGAAQAARALSEALRNV